MNEQSKAAHRRYFDGAFHQRYFVGRGIDIGGKTDPLAQYVGVFPLMRSVDVWDVDNGDAQLMTGVPDGSYDFVHSSHCLEHMRSVPEALDNWVRIVKPGGFLVITVPDEDLYEQRQWPSRYNPDHKWTFTLYKTESWSPRSVNLIDLAREFADRLELERLVLLRDFFRERLRQRRIDQTLTPVAECGIEVIWRKRPDAAARPLQTGGVPIPDRELYRPVFSPWLGDREFRQLYGQVRNHSLVSADRCWVLYTLARQALAVPGEFWECGVYKGGTAAMLARVMERGAAPAARTLRLFDTFGGMPETRGDKDWHRAGDFSDTSLEQVKNLVKAGERADYRVGTIPQTFADLEGAVIALAHVDVDVYQSVLDACRFIYPRLAPGGFMVVDDYGFVTCPGARAAVDEYFRALEARPLVLPTGQAVVFKSRPEPAVRGDEKSREGGQATALGEAAKT